MLLILHFNILFCLRMEKMDSDWVLRKEQQRRQKKHKKPNISMRQFFAFRLHERKNESHALLHSRRLFQQFVVDAFTTIESNRLRYLKLNQPSLRSDSYDSIKESENAGKVDMNEQGTEFTLPASFVGSPRYMKNNYLDAMTICKHFGFPDLFITFTCNPKWPEITRYVKARKLKAEDRSDIICRIFKIKLDSLMDSLTKKNILGETRSYERSYCRSSLLETLERDIQKMTCEQRETYEQILLAVNKGDGGMFFVSGFGGTGKTFLWKLLSAAIRSRGDIVLNVASSGIASLLLQGGRTAHSRFGIP
ncbi:unnamed protein product [Brassica rapa subsp. narinosa]